MRCSWKAIIVLSAIACFKGFSFASPPDDSLFKTPDILANNVAFWKSVYAGIPVSGGYIHDALYPLVIFDTLRNNPRALEIRNARLRAAAIVKIIGSQPESSWGDAERAVFALYKKYADSGALWDAQDRIRFQQGQKERFREGIVRSGLYLDTIKNIFKKYGIPERIAYLPHVESSFDCEAYSCAGAAGIFQFMRRTGRLFGMTINYSIDERRDPSRSATAAARYLSQAYRDLGSWPLAVTSYNYGVAGMKQAVAQTGSSELADIICNYSNRRFQFAAKNFYACLLAASELAIDRNVYFPGATPMPPLHYNDVKLDFFTSPRAICGALKLPLDLFASYNPAIKPALIGSDRPLPKGLLIHIPPVVPPEAICAALKGMPDSLKKDSPDRLRFYRVEAGDNLWTIAKQLGVSVDDLAAENELTEVKRIRIGLILRLPKTEAAKSAAVALPKPAQDSLRPAAPEQPKTGPSQKSFLDYWK